MSKMVINTTQFNLTTRTGVRLANRKSNADDWYYIEDDDDADVGSAAYFECKPLD